MNVQGADLDHDSLVLFMPPDAKAPQSETALVSAEVFAEAGQSYVPRPLSDLSVSALNTYIAQEIVSTPADQRSFREKLCENFRLGLIIVIGASGNIAFTNMSKEFADSFVPAPYNEPVGYTFAAGNITTFGCFTTLAALDMYKKLRTRLSPNARKILEHDLSTGKKYAAGALAIIGGLAAQVVPTIAAIEYNEGILQYLYPGLILISNLGLPSWSLYNILTFKLGSTKPSPEETKLLEAKRQLIAMAEQFEASVISMKPAELKILKNTLEEFTRLSSDNDITLKFLLLLLTANRNPLAIPSSESWKAWVARNGFDGLGITCGLAALAQCWMGGYIAMELIDDNEVAKQFVALFVAFCNSYIYMQGSRAGCLSLYSFLLNKIHGTSTPTLFSTHHPKLDLTSKISSLFLSSLSCGAMFQFSMDYFPKGLAESVAVFSSIASVAFSAPAVQTVFQRVHSLFCGSRESQEYKDKLVITQKTQKLITALRECPLPEFAKSLRFLQTSLPNFRELMDPRDLEAYETKLALQNTRGALSTPLLQSAYSTV